MKKVLFVLFVVLIASSCNSYRHIEKDISYLSKRSAELENRINELELKIKTNQDNLRLLSDGTAVMGEGVKEISNSLIDIERILSETNKRVDSISMTTNSQSTIKPQISNSKSSEGVSVSSNSDNSWRCQAITKKGTQCKRAAQSGRRFCWQH